MDREARVHRALASPARSRIVAALPPADAAMDVEALSQRLELHPNTVRAHLSVLEECGLVSSAPHYRDRPGRPRLIYRATGTAAEVGSDHGYRFLANVLASYVAASAEDPGQIGEDAGTAWGRYLVERSAPFETPDAEEAVARVVALMEESGFDPQLDDTERSRPRLLLRRCPFLEVAKEHPQIVCSIHLSDCCAARWTSSASRCRHATCCRSSSRHCV